MDDEKIKLAFENFRYKSDYGEKLGGIFNSATYQCRLKSPQCPAGYFVISGSTPSEWSCRNDQGQVTTATMAN